MYNFIKIPYLSTSKVPNSTLIGVIDSSYSMQGVWPQVSQMWNQFTAEQTSKELIVFSDQSNYIPDCQTITPNIENYYPGCTTISAGFDELNKLLIKPSTKENVTVLFLSDGDDNYRSPLDDRLKLVEQQIVRNSKLNFITVGVGAQFPTKIAMQLRNMYHTGEFNVPPLFLINDPWKASEWHQNFSDLEKYLYHKSPVHLEQSVKYFPWSNLSRTIYENSWVISENHTKIVENEEKKLVFEAKKNLSIDEMVEILKQWLGQLQLFSYKQEVQEQAQQILNIIKKWKEEDINAQLKQKKEEKQALSFHEKVLKKTTVDIFDQFKILEKEFQTLSQENILNNLDDQQAALKLAIGTQLGKYHDRAVHIRGFSDYEYRQALDKFLVEFSSTVLTTETDQPPSIISNQTQKDILNHPGFMKGLNLCQDQYTLVENLPIVGYPLHIKITDGSMINPYLITVTGMAKDVSSETATDEQIELKMGDDDRKQLVNCIIPLLTEKDRDLAPLYSSTLFSVLMTFNVMKNADTCFENAYQALMANTLLYLITQNNSEWRENTLQKLFYTFQQTYSTKNFFNKYSEALIKTPRIATITEHPDISTKCEDPSKPIFTLFYLIKSQQITDPSKVQEILSAIFAEIIGRLFPDNVNLRKFFEFKENDLEQNIDYSIYTQEHVNRIRPNMIERYYTLTQIKKDVKKALLDKEFDSDIDFSVELPVQKIYFLQHGKFCLQNLKKIEKYCMDLVSTPDQPYQTILTSDNLMIWLKQAEIRNSMVRNTTKLIKNPKKILKKMEEQKKNELINREVITEKTLEIIQKEYQAKMVEIHSYVKPMTRDQLKSELKRLNIDTPIEQYKFNPSSNLLRNACMAPECPHYLQLKKNYTDHRPLYDEVPAFHKTVLQMKNEQNNEKIFEAILNSEFIDPYRRRIFIKEEKRQNFIQNKEKWIKIIRQVKENYQQFQQQQ